MNGVLSWTRSVATRWMQTGNVSVARLGPRPVPCPQHVLARPDSALLALLVSPIRTWAQQHTCLRSHCPPVLGPSQSPPSPGLQTMCVHQVAFSAKRSPRRSARPLASLRCLTRPCRPHARLSPSLAAAATLEKQSPRATSSEALTQCPPRLWTPRSTDSPS